MSRRSVDDYHTSKPNLLEDEHYSAFKTTHYPCVNKYYSSKAVFKS